MYRYIVQLMLHCSLLWTSCLRFLTKSPAIPQQLYKTALRGLSAIAELRVLKHLVEHVNVTDRRPMELRTVTFGCVWSLDDDAAVLFCVELLNGSQLLSYCFIIYHIRGGWIYRKYRRYRYICMCVSYRHCRYRFFSIYRSVTSEI